MKKGFRKWIALGVGILGLTAVTSCGSKEVVTPVEEDTATEAETQEEGKENLSNTEGTTLTPSGEYNKGVVLVKSQDDITDNMLTNIEYKSYERLYMGSSWYEIHLSDGADTEAEANKLNGLGAFDAVDYDYLMTADAEVESVDISANEYASDLTYLNTTHTKEGWKHMKDNGKTPGGSSDVVVAVIDTGVDYNHLDLRNNIWTNSAEIPNNGIDDDGNGYVDDYYGWDFVGEDNDPMDDMGHGTHVAGIIAAENNSIGTVGVAFNCKIMCLKAGAQSGSFTNSAIAEAVQYAYMNGASVINMSFGGESLSLAVEDALKDAYNQCVLVAAAGNSGLCNKLDCPTHYPSNVGIGYPAALPYVIGVMSTDATGSYISSFSNFDHYPYGTIEYETYAPGENIISTWPNNKYASLSGTSMACPVVAGIAALLRSNYSDRDLYSNKFIQSQIVNSGEGYPNVANAYNALTNTPKPDVYCLSDTYILDTADISSANNSNYTINSGETIKLGLELNNWGGKAINVRVNLNSYSALDSSLKNEYVTFLNNDLSFSDIGTYSMQSCELVYDSEGNLSDITNGFLIKISEKTPNDYSIPITVTISYNNGLDLTDTQNYVVSATVYLTTHNGYILPDVITEDTTFTSEQLYIVSHDVMIPEGVTVNFEAGCQILFYDYSYAKINTSYIKTPAFKVYGSLNFNGSAEDRISVKPSELYYGYAICFMTYGDNGIINFFYSDIYNFWGTFETNFYVNINLDHCYFALDKEFNSGLKTISNGAIYDGSQFSYINNISNSTLYLNRYCSYDFNVRGDFTNNYVAITNSSCGYLFLNSTNVSDNVFEFLPYDTEDGSGAGGQLRFSGSDVTFNNNVFISNFSYTYLFEFVGVNFQFDSLKESNGNYFDSGLEKYISSIVNNYYSSSGTPKADCSNDTDTDYSALWPYVKNIVITDQDGNAVTTINPKTNYAVTVTFTSDLDTSSEIKLQYGSRTPYSDYTITGAFTDSKTWVGTLNVKAVIEAGYSYFNVVGGVSAADAGKELINNANYFKFNVDKTTAMSMNLQAVASDSGIDLTWVQDDYDTLMGYNVYRSDSKDGNYTRLNTTVIDPETNTFTDENAEPGKTYWYTFTVVLSDMSESSPAGKVSATAKDTLAPSIYHTPVNQGYLNNNLVIFCTASDNVAVTSVTLFYRTVGATEWNSISMLKQNDKYSATILGSELSSEGLEYYITATDGVNTISKGSSEDYYSVIIKDASALSKTGDVDGAGVITAKDALMIIQELEGTLILTDDQFKRADLNGDETLSASEALRILQYINGNVTTLSMN